MEELRCSRCGKVAAHLLEAPLKAEEVLVACEECWSLWETTSLKIINEYRLNLGDPRHREVLKEQQRSFFNLKGEMKLF